MTQNKNISWLHAQLPDLVAKGILSAESAEALRRHYPCEGKSGLPLALLFFGVLGASLIGAGIILLLAHNWQDLGRPERTVISLLPLLLAQIITGGLLWRGEMAIVWREAAGVFHSLAVAACIALIAQTYHMPGSLDSFLITWMLLSLPVAYLLNAVTPLMIYLAGITAWAVLQQNMGVHAVGYWPLLILAAPFIVATVRANPFSPRSALVQWSAVVALTSALGFVLGRGMPGLWIPFYASWFGCLYLAGGLATRGEEVSGWLNPARVVGGAATLVLVLLLSWEWPWERVGWHYARLSSEAPLAGLWVDVLVSLALGGCLVAALISAVQRRRVWDLLLGSAAPVVIIGYVLTGTNATVFSMLLMNGYLMIVGIGLAIQGVREHRLRLFNTGMFVFSAPVVIRFFDSELSFIAKGLVFIVVGVGFMVCNLWLYRRKGSTP